ncbi:hypothetical protein D8B26_006846 [Coccidioides posadasii str. Silveira]|uniref:uncharacterized protein n=1 Tax=Coccidioides posadasii (strain RMSCC 757 / Silveira) TaxID=443226 RepID=UPI001BEFD402|nr:hypothetical protein D8B26_006846 [Coccidioides posadasii str. Silveira]
MMVLSPAENGQLRETVARDHNSSSAAIAQTTSLVFRPSSIKVEMCKLSANKCPSWVLLIKVLPLRRPDSDAADIGAIAEGKKKEKKKRGGKRKCKGKDNVTRSLCKTVRESSGGGQTTGVVRASVHPGASLMAG